MAILEKCCCFISLKKGSMIIAIISVIGNICNLVGCSVPVGLGKSAIHDYMEELVNKSMNETQDYDIDVNNVTTVCWISLIVGIVLAAINLLTSIKLLHGVRKEEPRKMATWIFSSTIAVVFEVASLMSILVTSGLIRFLAAGIIPLVIQIHFLLVVVSYRMELQSYTLLRNPTAGVADDTTASGYGSIHT